MVSGIDSRMVSLNFNKRPLSEELSRTLNECNGREVDSNMTTHIGLVERDA